MMCIEISVKSHLEDAGDEVVIVHQKNGLAAPVSVLGLGKPQQKFFDFFSQF